jgi:chloride channel 2
MNEELVVPLAEPTPKSLLERINDWIVGDRTYIWVLLTMVGFGTGLVAFLHDYVAYSIGELRKTIVFSVPGSGLQLFVWIIYNLIFQIFAISFTHMVSPTAEAAGVAGLKAYLNGAPITPLAIRNIVVRFIVLPVVLAMPVFLGKTDMFLGAALASLFSRLPFFRKLRRSPHLLQQAITCGLATGVASNFGTPVAGVLFAVETVGSYYSLRTYLKSFYATTFTAFTILSLHAVWKGRPFVLSLWGINVSPPHYDIPEVILFAILGVFCGILAAMFIKGIEIIYNLRDHPNIGRRKLIFFKWDWYPADSIKGKLLGLLENRIFFAILIFIIGSIVTFPGTVGPFMTLGPNRQAEDAFIMGKLLKSNKANADWSSDPQQYDNQVLLSLFLCFFIRYMMHYVCNTLPLPGGALVPLMCTGAVFGRFVGELFQRIFPRGFITSTPLTPATYALAGSAALSGGVTHAFSCSIILMEMGGLAGHIPMMFAVIIAIRVSKFFASVSSYDVMIRFRKWQGVLSEPKTDRDDLLCKDIMIDVTNQYVSTNSTRAQVCAVLDTIDPKQIDIPYVDQHMHFLGVVSRQQLEDAVRATEPVAADEEIEKPPTPPSEADQTITVSLSPEIEMQDAPVEQVKTNPPSAAPPAVVAGAFDISQMPVTSFSHLLLETTPVLRAHMIFSMLKLEQSYVVRVGKLVGLVRRIDIIKSKVMTPKPHVFLRLFNWAKRKAEAAYVPHSKTAV